MAPAGTAPPRRTIFDPSTTMIVSRRIWPLPSSTVAALSTTGRLCPERSAGVRNRRALPRKRITFGITLLYVDPSPAGLYFIALRTVASNSKSDPLPIFGIKPVSDKKTSRAFSGLGNNHRMGFDGQKEVSAHPIGKPRLGKTRRATLQAR